MSDGKPVEAMLRCTLRVLIGMAGVVTPTGLSEHPNVDEVPVSKLAYYVDVYSAFLKSLRSIPSQ